MLLKKVKDFCCRKPDVGFNSLHRRQSSRRKNDKNTMNMIQESCEMEKMLAGKMSRRIAAEDRYMDRIEKKEAAAETLIGEINKNGKTVSYINQIDRSGRFTGKTIEGSKMELVRYCIRNNYV